MTLQPLAGFKHFITHHCVTGSLRHVYVFNGYPISEELLLGLGSGVGFIYWQAKNSLPFLGGRANAGRPGKEGMEKAAGRCTGVKVELHRTESAARAEKALLELLESGQPAMLALDMGFLPYFDFHGQEYHFGGHVIVVCSLDLPNRQVLIADRDQPLHSVSLDVLAQARGGTGGGLFRTMYGHFLEEAAEITGEPKLPDIAKQFLTAAQRWDEVAGLLNRCYRAESSHGLLVQASQRLPKIAESEEQAWHALWELSL